MAVTPGNQAQLLLDGFNVHQFARSFAVSAAQDIHDSSVLGTTSRTKLTGLKHASATGEFFIDDTTSTGSYDVLKSRYNATPAILSFAPQGFTLGNRVLMMPAIQASINAKAIVGDLELMNLNVEASEDAVDYGVSLHALGAETSLDFTGTAVDNAAATTNGGVGIIHVTAIAGAPPEVQMFIQHSTDNATWLDLVDTFVNVSASGVQRVEVAPGTTIRRYLRVVVNEVEATSSITFAAAFARR